MPTETSMSAEDVVWRRLLTVIGFVLGVALLASCGQGAEDELAEAEGVEQDVIGDEDADSEVAELETDSVVEAATTTTEAAEPAETTSSTTDAAPIPVAPPVVTLREPGAEPRRELRFALVDGDEVVNTVSTQIVEQFADGESLIPPQPIQTIIDVAVSRRPVDGGFEAVSEIIDAQIGADTDPALAVFIETNITDLIGVTTTATVDDRGIISLNAEDPISNQLVNDVVNDVINQSNPLPEEPVGLGGSWTTVATTQESGLTVMVETTSTVVEMTVNGVVLDISYVQTVEGLGQEVDLEGVPAVVDVWDVTGMGTIELDFSQFSPVTASVSETGTQSFTFPGARNLEQRHSALTVIETTG